MAKKLHIKTYGCQMNVYDSSRMADVLEPLGYEETAELAEADLVILNTCHIREKAAEKVYSELGRLRDARQERVASGGSDMLIAVGGCVAQAEGEEMLSRAPYVDIVMGSQSYHHLPRLIHAAEKKRKERLFWQPERGELELDFPEVQKFDLLPEAVKPQGRSAFLSVQEGCDKFCTFCVVPYTRGAEYSRPVDAVLREAQQYVEKGAVEIMLLGQNVNAYHGEDAAGKAVSLAELMHRLARIDGLERIRYTTSHPRDMSEDLIAAHGEIEALMPFLHLPVQAGSDRVLKAMNRRHTAADYLGMTEKLRKIRPDMGFSSDFIVGFPGETEEDFAATLALAETVGYASAYSFKYSPRPGTPAAGRDNQVPEEAKAERLARLQQVIARHQLAFNRASVGKRMAVLLDRAGREPGQMIGRSPWMQSVHVENTAHLANQLVEVEILEGQALSLKGEYSISHDRFINLSFPRRRESSRAASVAKIL